MIRLKIKYFDLKGLFEVFGTLLIQRNFVNSQKQWDVLKLTIFFG